MSRAPETTCDNECIPTGGKRDGFFAVFWREAKRGVIVIPVFAGSGRGAAFAPLSHQRKGGPRPGEEGI